MSLHVDIPYIAILPGILMILYGVVCKIRSKNIHGTIILGISLLIIPIIIILLAFTIIQTFAGLVMFSISMSERHIFYKGTIATFWKNLMAFLLECLSLFRQKQGSIMLRNGRIIWVKSILAINPWK